VYCKKNFTLTYASIRKNVLNSKVKKALNTTLTLILLSSISPLSIADSIKNPIIQIVTEHLPPYQIVAEDKSISGFAVDIIEETMARSHFAYSLKSYPWVRSYKLAQRKPNHCLFSVARLRSREKLFKWVGPISKVSNTTMWALKGQDIIVDHIDDARKYTVAVNQDDIAHIGLLERGFNEKENLYVLSDAKSLVNLLVTRPEIDLIVADDTTIKFRAKIVDVSMDQLERIYEIKDMPLNFFLACSKSTDDNIIEHLAQKMQSIYDDGTYDLIWNKWRSKLIEVN
jgi:polar amino acid transport system substrate-binding protein